MGARVTALWLLVLAGLATPAATATLDAERLKAAFLVRFTSFVAWPESDPGAVFDLCIGGNAGMLDALRDMTQGKRVRGRDVAVRRLRDASESSGCQLVFVGRDAPGSIAAWLGGHGVLTVGETPDFTRSGGVIGFVRRGQKLRFEVHRGAARRAGLHLDARLLDLAERVHE